MKEEKEEFLLFLPGAILRNFSPIPQGCLEQVGEGGEGVHSLGNYFSLHVCFLLRRQGPLDERPPPHLHTCSRSQTTKQERALGVEQAGVLRFHPATWQSQKDSDPQQKGTGLKYVGRKSNTRESHWPKRETELAETHRHTESHTVKTAKMATTHAEQTKGVW